MKVLARYEQPGIGTDTIAYFQIEANPQGRDKFLWIFLSISKQKAHETVKSDELLKAIH